MASDTDSKTNDKLTVRVGVNRKTALRDHADANDMNLTDATILAVDNWIAEQEDERVEHMSIARLSAWDMYSLALYSMAALSAVLHLAGFDMLIYAIGFTVMGLIGWVAEYRVNGSVGYQTSEVAE